MKKAQEKVAAAEEAVENETDDVEAAEKRLDEVAEKEGATAGETEEVQKDKEKQETEFANAEKTEKAANDELEKALSAAATSNATASATAASSIARQNAKAQVAIANTMQQMQANYLNDHNVDALKVVCLTEEHSELQGWCATFVKWLVDDHEEFQRDLVKPTAGDSSLLQQIFVGAKHPLGADSNGKRRE